MPHMHIAILFTSIFFSFNKLRALSYSIAILYTENEMQRNEKCVFYSDKRLH